MKLRTVFGMGGRAGFGRLLKKYGLTRAAVEVGTHRGEFAAALLASWPGRLTCVDPYEPMYDPDDPAALGDRSEDLRTAQLLLAGYGNRVGFMIERSAEAARSFGAGSLDFVYVDAKHRYADVLLDLETWWTKLRAGGVLAGHDIVCPGMEPVGGGWGLEVGPAVATFSKTKGLDVWIVQEADETGWSYFMRRPT